MNMGMDAVEDLQINRRLSALEDQQLEEQVKEIEKTIYENNFHFCCFILDY